MLLQKSGGNMSNPNDISDEYDFSHGKRGAVIPHRGKTRITIWLDNKVLDWFKADAEKQGRGYQTALNEVLRNHILKKNTEPQSLQSIIRKTVREELKRWLSKER